ncbi:interleukin-22 receptor subunit alpha-1 isoform X1 [Myotis myotis]|uniref:Interleukin-22 receptor subunit alpha-1 n=2 Tax=Myotis myotis TaxID=51298 RepID=A0A7J7ZWE7_MYOMY|nr:interleukin-22 receptor subunit alpha-1 isoform X1 [Myotis myotis]KAF6378441.1 interleukin 22 receptor subunit alpha 1 [Myotis myotis]
MRTLLTILAAGSLAAARIAEDTSDLLQHVTFQSSNFENILTWDSGLESAPDTVYSVEYKTYGEVGWLAKKSCQRITRKFCNLTTETGSLEKLYYARVTATSAGGRSATKMTDRFSPRQHTTIKPPDVTCIPTVRSIQMIVHPTSTPLQAEDGHWLTLEDIFHDLFYRLDLHINQTYQMHLGGKQREYEFIGLTPDTEFLGTITIFVPTYSKESAPYTCRVRTLPDRTWTYSFSGAFLFSMGFLVAGLCYLSYRYITKPPKPPHSLDVQRVLTFQPLRFIQEHVLIPVLDLSGPSSLAQPVQYSQVMVSAPKEPPGAPPLHSRSEITYLGQADLSILQPSRAAPPQAGSPPSYAPQAAPEAGPPAYTPQVTPEAKAPSYAPQAVSSYAPQAAPDSWPPSYGLCMGGSGKDSPPGTPSGPRPLRTEDQLQKEPPAADLSLQGLASGATEEPQEAKPFPQHLCVDPDRAPDTTVLHKGEPGTPGYLKGQLPLLSSVQIEGHPGSLPLHTPSLPCCPMDQGSCPGGLLESLVCTKDDGPGSEPEAPGASALEQPAELDSLFRGLALTVQWES